MAFEFGAVFVGGFVRVPDAEVASRRAGREEGAQRVEGDVTDAVSRRGRSVGLGKEDHDEGGATREDEG